MRYLSSLLLVLALSVVLVPACNGGDSGNNENNAEQDASDATDDVQGDGTDVDADPGPQTVTVQHLFAEGEGGWESDVADYRVGNESGVAFRGELRSLPEELNEPGTGYYLDALNPSASVFPFIRREVTQEEGIYPETEYRVTWTIRFATNYAEQCQVNPGTEMYLKAGATTYKPAVVQENDMNVLNYDKGEGQVGGPAARVLGDIAHDGVCEGTTADDYDFVLQSLESTGGSSVTVESNQDGSLWLLAGIEVDISESISIYIIEVDVTIEPVTTQ